MENYNDYKEYSVKIYDIRMAISVLNWDQETKMPKNGSKFRAQQLSTLAKIAYELSTDEKYGKLLETLNNDQSLNSDKKRNIFLSRKKHQIGAQSESLKESIDHVLALQDCSLV